MEREHACSVIENHELVASQESGLNAVQVFMPWRDFRWASYGNWPELWIDLSNMLKNALRSPVGGKLGARGGIFFTIGREGRKRHFLQRLPKMKEN